MPGTRPDARITKMNRTLSMFLRNFLFRVWIQTHKPVCSEKSRGALLEMCPGRVGAQRREGQHWHYRKASWQK